MVKKLKNVINVKSNLKNRLENRAKLKSQNLHLFVRIHCNVLYLSISLFLLIKFTFKDFKNYHFNMSIFTNYKISEVNNKQINGFLIIAQKLKKNQIFVF